MTSSEQMPWGSLPLEHYVLAQWASLASHDLDKRRRQLAQQFTAIGYSGRFLHATLSASQSDSELPPRSDWEGILAPLRTDFQRQLASPYSFQTMGNHCWGVIWLRTCYDEGTDEAHQNLLNELNQELALEVDENILDDAALYNYGDDWRRIFEVIPERLFEETLDDANAMPTPEEHEARIREARRNLDIDEVADIDAFKQATARLHSEAVCKYLFVSDKVALDTGKVLIVFYDDCGRTVRQSRVQPEDCEQIAGAWFDISIDEMDEFVEGDIGPEYLPRGSCGL
ncbi:hypothetical protein Q7P37_006133 [Cladosporium fusiforme]